jgi:hypothetical protein
MLDKNKCLEDQLIITLEVIKTIANTDEYLGTIYEISKVFLNRNRQ